MSRIYIYPKPNPKKISSPNPYVANLENSLRDRHAIVNEKYNSNGIIDLFFKVFQTDIFFFNWIEDLPHKKFGKIQTVLFLIFMSIVKCFNKKIIWVLHNKYTHEKKNATWSKYIFKNMLKNSNVIFTHSKEGIDFVKREYPEFLNKLSYVIHPVGKLRISNKDFEAKYDFLIWGTIYPYKGIIDFLKYRNEDTFLSRLKIVISGNCSDENLKSELLTLIKHYDQYYDEFLDLDSISVLAAQSKYVLFTYNSDSVLSSGSLMDTIGMGTMIIGPEKGVFKDLKSFPFIVTYRSYNEIYRIYKNNVNKSRVMLKKEIERFYLRNNWDNFGKEIIKLSNGIL